LINGEKVILVKPITFMNLSGEAVRPLMDYYNVDLEDLVVIYDDLDLPAGKVRLREKGGHGGHNGIRSLIAHLSTKEFKRMRLGIGRPVSQQPVVDYVLQRFHKEEIPDIVDSVKKAADATETWLKEPFLNVMNDFNR
jgi:peptidyl-tRNA hydrolase, PTH1 family